jgi:DNA-binding MarR family transcriptional regulator
MDQAAARQPADRKRGARAAEGAVQRHLAALRRHGGALPQARRHADERDFAFFDGVDRLVSDGLVARAQRNGDRRTSFISLTRKGRALFADMAAAHESWVDELLGGLSVRDAEQMSTKLKSFRSDWEGEA